MMTYYNKEDSWGPFAVATVAVAILGMIALLVFGAYAFGYSYGETDAYVAAWTAQKSTCLKEEQRQFADVGFWFIPGSGEITTRTVCVQWLVNR